MPPFQAASAAAPPNTIVYPAERIIATVSIAWAIFALLYQLASARGRLCKDLSVPAGNPIKGVIFNFTYALLPSHKETIRLHSLEFAIGVTMHIGVFLAILKILILVVYPDAPHVNAIAFSIIMVPALLSGLYLLVRRIATAELRTISSPDDYFSNLLTIGFIALALAHEIGLAGAPIFLVYSSMLFIYMPFGKLSHWFYFFIARADFGARLGYRGTYPARRPVKE